MCARGASHRFLQFIDALGQRRVDWDLDKACEGGIKGGEIRLRRRRSPRRCARPLEHIQAPVIGMWPAMASSRKKSLGAFEVSGYATVMFGIGVVDELAHFLTAVSCEPELG